MPIQKKNKTTITPKLIKKKIIKLCQQLNSQQKNANINNSICSEGKQLDIFCKYKQNVGCT